MVSSLSDFHLHDVKGYSDHHVPGIGEVDFKLLKKYVKEGYRIYNGDPSKRD